MPNMKIQDLGRPAPTARRYKIKATGQTGTALTTDGSTRISQSATIGAELNVQLIDLCDDMTGEVRTFRADGLEQIETVVNSARRT